MNEKNNHLFFTTGTGDKNENLYYSFDQLLCFACISENDFMSRIHELAHIYMQKRSGKRISAYDKSVAKKIAIGRYLPRIENVDGVKSIRLKGREN